MVVAVVVLFVVVRVAVASVVGGLEVIVERMKDSNQKREQGMNGEKREAENKKK